MLPKINRIKRKKDFEIIFKNGLNFKDTFLVLKVFKNKSDFTRFGFIISQKVSKKAVVRNKIRRRLAEIVWSEFKEIKKGLDIVIICLPGLEKEDFSELEISVNKIFKKAKILNV
jgi:ribonuclease P protein component